jgi:nucleotide-binding universal stress UspA family protein
MNAGCDVVMIKMVHLDKMKKILLPTSGGPHAGFALELAPAIAAAYDSRITVAMVVPPAAKEAELTQYREQVDESVSRLKEKVKRVDGEIVKSRSISAAILRMTERYDACIVGAAREGLMQQLIFGSIPEKIAKKGRHTVIMVKKYEKGFTGFIHRLFHRSKHRVTKR